MATLIMTRPLLDDRWAVPVNRLEAGISKQFRTLPYSRLEIGRYTLENPALSI